MPVIRNGQLEDDAWTRVGDDEPLPAGPVIVSLARWRRDLAALTARGGALGLVLKSSERAHEIGADAGRFSLIVLEMPLFRDGRAFSAARLLRERYDFAGDIRASGHVLPDQALFLTRCGVTSFEIADAARTPSFAAALKEFTVAFQPGAGEAALTRALRRRIAPAASLAQAAE